MNSDIWQSLLNLESRDIVSEWFETIHGRQLNARRAREITASARQGREYFRSASSSSFAVRPLLAFYGVASLCRALTLLHRRDSGEEGLKQGHGLKTVGWSTTLTNDIAASLKSLRHLRVGTCEGLFSDLAAAINSRNSLPFYDRHVRIPRYAEAQLGQNVSLYEIMSRLPDLRMVKTDDDPYKWIRVKDFEYSPLTGAKIIIYGKPDVFVCKEYENSGYVVADHKEEYSNDTFTSLTIGLSGYLSYTPQFLDTRIRRTMGGHPSPYLISKFGSNTTLSQISVTYIASYILGMLARYNPTHWSALMMGEKGDAIWPNINALQNYIETALPELVLEMISDSVFGHDEEELDTETPD